MTNSTRSLYSTSASAVALSVALLMATPVAAQTTTADPGAAPAPVADEADTIVVTGFRASLQNAVNKKKKSDQIVESISAEDIGKLPDASIAESIARLPGLTSQRLAGRSSVISIRGFGPDFSTTLLNGREQTSTGDNRAVEYDQYPSEVINQVNIYKTPMASVVGQGLSGTVDLRTIRPLEYGKRVLAIGARGVKADIGKLNADSTDKGYRVNAIYVDQFADGKLGVSIAGSYNNEPYQVEEFNSWGYGGAGPNNAALIGGSKSYITSTELKRFGLAGSIQFKPVPNFTSTFDGFFSDFKDDITKRGIELPLGFGGFFGTQFNPATATESDGTYVSGTFTGVQGVVRNVAQTRNAKLYSFGWNNRYDSDNGFHAMADISYSKTKRNELIFETYAGTGPGNNPRSASNPTGDLVDTIGFTSSTQGTVFTHLIDYSDPNVILLTDPNGWGGVGYSNNRIVNDRIWQYQGSVSKDLEGGFISKATLGANYTDHDKSLRPDEANILLANNATSLVLPSQYRRTPSEQSYLGLGPVLSYDPIELLGAGIYTLVNNNSNNDVLQKAFAVSEKLVTLYGQLDIKTTLGSADLTGNVGVQAVHADQSSTALTLGAAGVTSSTRGAKYWDVMPSLNLSLRYPSDVVIRLGLAREVMRPRMDDMRLALGYGVDTTVPGQPIISGGNGNPELRPFRANAADLSFEKYFGIKGYIAAQLFYKKIDTFVVSQNLPGTPFDYTGFPTPTNYQSTNPAGPNYLPPSAFSNGRIFQPYNISGGKLYGIEVAGTLPIGEMISALDGFGLTGGVSYTKSRIRTVPGGSYSDLPGYSRYVANGTAYFEKWGFSARGSVRYRSSFQGEVSGFGANRVQRRALAETIIDGQVGYEFQKGNFLEGLSIYIQGQNLTNEPFVTANPGQPLQIIDYQRYGRRFLAGFNFKF